MSIAKDLANRRTDMVLLKSEASYMSIEGLKLNSKIGGGRLPFHHPSQVLLEASRGVSKHTKLKWKIWRKKYFYHEMNEIKSRYWWTNCITNCKHKLSSIKRMHTEVNKWPDPLKARAATALKMSFSCNLAQRKF